MTSECTMQYLEQTLAALQVGEHVEAVGMDVRGYDVERVGYVLATPEWKTYNKQKVLRLFIGPKGLNPEERSSWATLVPGREHQVSPVPPPDPTKWHLTPISQVPGIRASSYTPVIYYGGKGARTVDAHATIQHTGDGEYEIRSTDTNAVLLTGARIATKIHWRYAPQD